MGLGVSTVRLVGIALFFVAPPLTVHQSIGISFWMGWIINMTAAEIWIHRTRAA